MRIQLHPHFAQRVVSQVGNMAVGLKRLLQTSLLLTSLCISVFDYWRDGGLPLIELATTGSIWPQRDEKSTETRPHNSTFSCTCSPPGSSSKGAPRRSSSAGKFVSEETAVEKLIPLNQLKKKINFSQHPGLSFLRHSALNRYYLCAPSNKPPSPAEKKATTTECRKRKFQDRQGPIVALVSSPGSGNTWLRFLLEQSSGIFTGSIYCDHSLKKSFPGEHIVSGNVVVVKTHRCDSRELPEDVQEETGVRDYSRAVVLIRDPFDSLVSEANRRWNTRKNVNGHVGLAEEKAFIGNTHWDWYVETMSNSWGYLIHTWLAHSAGSTHNHTPTTPVHLVQYEKLVNNTTQELKRVIEFLNITVDDQTLECAIEKGRRGNFKRTKHLNFDPFSRKNRAVVNHMLRQVSPILARYDISYPYRH